MQVTTFYSYKGGLGRSLLLAWNARALALQGRSVVALDLDLEAPGLSFKFGFDRKAELGSGVVGLLAGFQRGDAPPSSLRDWLRPVPNVDGLSLFPAGPLDSAQYWRNLASISWERLFFGRDPQGARFFHWLREAIEREMKPDHLLIDARTGVTEMGGAALSLMSDQVLALVGTSEEGIHGTREVLRAVTGGPRAPGRPAPRIGLVLSRMPPTMSTLDLQRHRRAVRDQIREEADPLTSTVEVDLPLVMRSEQVLQVDERRALDSGELRVHDDYQAALSWLEGGEVPAEPPGVRPASDGSVEGLKSSIALQRQLAERDAEHYMPELAASLQNLGSALANQGRHGEAILAAQESVGILRVLAGSHADRYQAGLAPALFNLGLLLSDQGRIEEGLDAAQEAVVLFRQLATSRPDAFERSLAGALTSLGNRLATLGRLEEGLDAAQEAVVLSRRLAAARPDAFEIELARALNTTGILLSSLGHLEEGLVATQEAVEIRRRLAKSHPGSSEPDLARSLGFMGTSLVDSDPRAAAACFDEALRVLLPHLRRRPRVLAELSSRLAKSLEEACLAASTEPDAELLGEIAGILDSKGESA